MGEGRSVRVCVCVCVCYNYIIDHLTFSVRQTGLVPAH